MSSHQKKWGKRKVYYNRRNHLAQYREMKNQVYKKVDEE